MCGYPYREGATGPVHTRPTMEGIYHGPGEGESLFGGRIVLKSGLEQLTVTESWFATARPGADLHFHREHADSFYVLEGELAIRIGDDEHLSARAAPSAPHPASCTGSGARCRPASSTSTRRMRGFAEHLRELDRGEPGGFDSVDAAPGDGLTDTGAVSSRPARARRCVRNHRVATIKVGTRRALPDRVRARAHPRGARPPQPHRSHGLLLRARRLGELPARRREDRGRPGVVRRRAARSRARVQDRSERRPAAQRPRTEHGLSRRCA